MFMIRNCRLLLAAALAVASMQAAASVVTTRASLGGTGTLDWAQLGADGSSPAVLPAAVNTSIGGLTATVGGSGGTLTRFDEGGGTFAGNFSLADALITTFDVGGTIVIDFNQGVSRVGAQIQGFDLSSFDGIITAYDAANAVLETYSVNDPSVSIDPDGSAMFLGISRASADIDRIEFSIANQNSTNFAINFVSISQEVVRVSVPEPGSLALAALALAGFGFTRKFSRRA